MANNKSINILKVFDILLKFTPRFFKVLNQEPEDGWHRVEYWVYTDKKIITRIGAIKTVHGLTPESEGYDVTREF